MATYTELTAAGVTTRDAASLTGLPRSTATRRRPAPSRVPAPPRVPVNRLSAAERLEILAVLDAPRFVDLPPIQIYATLLDEGTYLCSISTLYRILAEHAQLVERRRIARHPARTVPELVATGPGQVYSWDITKLAGPAKGVYYDAYVMIDIYSRYIVGVRVHPHESGLLAVDMMRQVFGLHGVPQVVHADRGTSMTSKTVAQLLADLEVTRSHSRPEGVERQPVLRGLVQNLEVRPDVPRTIRLPGRRATVHGRFRRRLQPPPPPHRHRSAHPRRRPLRPRRRCCRRTRSDPRRRPPPPS